jgi:hypothetical protein
MAESWRVLIARPPIVDLAVSRIQNRDTWVKSCEAPLIAIRKLPDSQLSSPLFERSCGATDAAHDVKAGVDFA